MTSIDFKINWLSFSTKPGFILTCLCLFIFSTSTLSAEETMEPPEEKGKPHGMPMMVDGSPRFAPCPKRPNCVNSIFFQDKAHYILPLSIMPIGEKSRMDRLLEVINSFENIKVAEVDDNYLRVEFSSKLFGFIDDVEFLINDSHTDIRSASRVGYSDMGVNRRRVEEIRTRLAAQENREDSSSIKSE
jgi:uncharacterized protein (DUF1499 family)